MQESRLNAIVIAAMILIVCTNCFPSIGFRVTAFEAFLKTKFSLTIEQTFTFIQQKFHGLYGALQDSWGRWKPRERLEAVEDGWYQRRGAGRRVRQQKIWHVQRIIYRLGRYQPLIECSLNKLVDPLHFLPTVKLTKTADTSA
ncbi:hypothetical protein M514_08331 [Trichuris suis]|uniref:Uncharacterized protein n=1 Tax=Trichuris suis TaxID=68888 RepID=A0A085M0P4_9BILA|nr:hypothetical protein M513_08331 [Trichuris suis]KFD63403.1 hypothetical protein M514_08331 [Trichuris suis]